MGLGDYIEWDEERRQQFLIDQLSADRSNILNELVPDDRVREVMKDFTKWPTYPQVYVAGSFLTPAKNFALGL